MLLPRLYFLSTFPGVASHSPLFAHLTCIRVIPLPVQFTRIAFSIVITLSTCSFPLQKTTYPTTTGHLQRSGDEGEVEELPLRT